MIMRQRFCCVCVSLSVFVICGSTQAVAASALETTQGNSWQEIMVAARRRLPDLAAGQKQVLENLELGPWYSAGPIKGGKFTDTSFAQKPVDLTKVDKDGNNLWTERSDINDGVIYQGRCDRGGVEPLYLYRPIRAPRTLTLTAGFGARSAIDVWLNGEKVLTSIKEQRPRKNQYLLDLDLKAGENQLLVRIFNWNGRYAFYFSPEPHPALKQFRQIKSAFRIESAWMEKQLGPDGCTAWFDQRDSAELEKNMIEKVLSDLSTAGGSLRSELNDVWRRRTPAGDKQWLDLYVRACTLTDAVRQSGAQRERLAMLQRAAQSLAASDAQFTQWAQSFASRLSALNKKLDALDPAAERDKLDSITAEVLKLEEELITKKPDESFSGPLLLDAGQFKSHVDSFNAADAETIVNFVPNALSWDWMRTNIPYFECPDPQFEKIYYYRWWSFRKHIKQTPDGFVLTEFLDNVGHSGKYNTISCALAHHIFEGRWLHDKRYIDEYALFWYRGNNGGPQEHFHRYSNWTTCALYNRYLVNGDADFLIGLLDDFVKDFEAWRQERGVVNGLFWQYDVLDGGEESISGSRYEKNVRPTLNSYMYGNAVALAGIAALAGRTDLATEYRREAAKIKSLVQNLLWDGDAKFFKARYEAGGLCDAREAIGFIPWYFNLPDSGYEQAWLQIKDPAGFSAPMGLTTAERRHPAFRSHGVGTCEWDGAVWPYASTQTLTALANVIRNYDQSYVGRDDYFDALLTYARSHSRDGKPYIGEYLDEVTGEWLTPDSDRSRFYNHSTFCDLVISGLVGIVPRQDEILEVDPLLPDSAWDWFCLDNVFYHGRLITVIWDSDGSRYGRGKGLHVFADGRQIGHCDKLERITAQMQ